MASVEEATGGQIDFDHFPSEQAAKAKAQLDAVKGGILDMALLGTPYHADALPLNSVVALPGYYGTAEQGTRALQSMLQEGPLRDELLKQGLTPVYGFVLPPYQVLARTRLGALEDWKALDIRTSGATQAMTARGLGGVGISIPGPEVYTAVERGRVDAVLFPLASVQGYKLDEVVTHISTNGSFGGYSFVMVIRTDRFEALSPEIREAMLTKGAETAAHVAAAQDESVDKLIASWGDDGIDTYAFTEEEQAALRCAMELVTEDWIDRMGGEVARDVLERYRALTAE